MTECDFNLQFFEFLTPSFLKQKIIQVIAIKNRELDTRNLHRELDTSF